MPPLPFPNPGLIVTVGFEVPVFCGGFDAVAQYTRQACYKFNPSTKGWDQVIIEFHIAFDIFLTQLIECQ
jgi:hypothetical protein